MDGETQTGKAEKAQKAKVVVKVATSSWQQIIKTSREKREEAKTVDFLLPEASTADKKADDAGDDGGFFLDFGGGPPAEKQKEPDSEPDKQRGTDNKLQLDQQQQLSSKKPRKTEE